MENISSLRSTSRCGPTSESSVTRQWERNGLHLRRKRKKNKWKTTWVKMFRTIRRMFLRRRILPSRMSLRKSQPKSLSPKLSLLREMTSFKEVGEARWRSK